MIEPSSKSGRKKGPAVAQKEGEEEEETAKEAEAAPEVEQVSSLQDSILSHTASMVVGPNGLLDEKDKQVTNKLHSYDLLQIFVFLEWEDKSYLLVWNR